MNSRALSREYSVSPQLQPAQLVLAARQGFRSIICARPDNEEPGQPNAAAMEEAAKAAGLGFAHIPISSPLVDATTAQRTASALATLPGPILGYCRSGTRAEALWNAVQTIPSMPGNIDKRYDVVIVGGGSAGIATASSLLRRKPALDIAIIEPADIHYYQPGWTLVGAGVFRPEQTRKPMAEVMPHKVKWIKAAAAGFAPDENLVHLADGSTVSYRVLVVATGLKLDWDAIPGLTETLGRNGVTSNYRYDIASYTEKLSTALTSGRAIFTQPPMPIKCAGAPQKAMYLSCDRWLKAGTLKNISVEFDNAGAVLFGVAAYVPALMRYIERYNIQLNFETKLVAVNGNARVARFERKGMDGPEAIEREFDLLHAVPPQVAPDCVRRSALAAASGFVAVDETTLQHPSFPNVFALGDACATSNAKTAAAARQQAPVVAVNVLAQLGGKPLTAAYDGYGSCPLTVERGRIVLAEFGYGGKLMPTFPTWLLDGSKPTRAAWFLKDRVLPTIYWQAMLKGREWMARPGQLNAPAQPR